jgi:hypothetical protein
MKRKDKVTSAELSEGSLLIKDRAASDFCAGFGELVDGFESIQVRRVLLPHEVNGRICSHTQGAQDLVIIEARGAGFRLGTDDADGSLKKRKVSWEAILNLTGSVQDSPPSSAPANEQVTERGIETLC